MEAEMQTDRKREETLRAIGRMGLLDDNLMILAFDRNIEAAELMLNIILRRNDLKVMEVVSQREMFWEQAFLYTILTG